jgi:pimeloyl-ACP methyl ester carboxylesterase
MPATPSSREIDGVEVHVEGEGPETILMLHGWPDTHRLWDGQVAALKDRFRCVRFTLPGFDLARPPRQTTLPEMSRLLLQVLDAVGPGVPVTLLLHDWGCFYGYDFAARHPERVQRIVGVDVGDVASRAFVRSLGAKQKAMIAAYQLPLAAAWKLRGRAGDAISRRVARVLRCPAEPAAIGWQMAYPYALQWSGGFKDAKRFEPHCPVLYLFGTRKPLMFHSPEWLVRIGAVPGNAVHGLRTGHWVMLQAPGEFNEKLLAWLSQEVPGIGAR